jgi:GNAT superfamily N-acetyltransferase
MSARQRAIARLLRTEFPCSPQQEYGISLFRPEDAQGVARLVYDNYGDGHPFDYVYDPDEIARRFASGEQYAVVARTEAGAVLGMIGVYRCAPNPRIYELAQLLLLNGQRGKGIASALWRRAMRELPALAGAVSIFGEAVCTHAFSQKMCEETGMLFSGLVEDAIPASAYAIQGFKGERTSLVLCSKVLVDFPHEAVLPESLLIAYAEHCRDFGLKRAIRRLERRPLPEKTEYEALEFPVAKSIKLLVRVAGKDLPRILAESEDKAGEHGVTQAAFDLGDERSAAGVELARERGYYLGGFLPLWFGSDGALLHKRRQAPRFDAVQTFTQGALKAKRMAQRDYESLGPR